jgi:hypothetical protein
MVGISGRPVEGAGSIGDDTVAALEAFYDAIASRGKQWH